MNRRNFLTKIPLLAALPFVRFEQNSFEANGISIAFNNYEASISCKDSKSKYVIQIQSESGFSIEPLVVCNIHILGFPKRWILKSWKLVNTWDTPVYYYVFQDLESYNTSREKFTRRYEYEPA